MESKTAIDGAYAEVMSKLAAYESTGLTPVDCAELSQAREERRLMVLPCKEGDILWFADLNRKEIYREAYFSGVVGMHWSTRESMGDYFPMECIGRTVFLTCEEAIAACTNKQ